MGKAKKLMRAKEKDSMLFGVCAGLGEYFGVDPTVVRLLWVLLTLISFGAGVLFYLIAWIIIPRK